MADAQGQLAGVVGGAVEPGTADPDKLEQVWAGKPCRDLEDLELWWYRYNTMYAQESHQDRDSTCILWLRFIRLKLTIPYYSFSRIDCILTLLVATIEILVRVNMNRMPVQTILMMIEPFSFLHQSYWHHHRTWWISILIATNDITLIPLDICIIPMSILIELCIFINIDT